jgi:hypothetical protein
MTQEIYARQVAAIEKAKANAKERERREREHLRPLKVLNGVQTKTGRREKYYNVRKCSCVTGEVIEQYPTIRDASEANGIPVQNIRQCLAEPSVNKSAGGFKWLAKTR